MVDGCGGGGGGRVYTACQNEGMVEQEGGGADDCTFVLFMGEKLF